MSLNLLHLAYALADCRKFWVEYQEAAFQPHFVNNYPNCLIFERISNFKKS